ncbi:MAG TPA: hypothetical protein VG057_14795 [Solirubrobacteraceae bacterium]|jgi:hypothetical protein|nr:hypothetical protein [Solirubrobacteraceae bacterium]
METRAEQVLTAIIDDALDVTAQCGHLSTADLVDVLLDLRLAIVDVSAFDRTLASSPSKRAVAGARR